MAGVGVPARIAQPPLRVVIVAVHRPVRVVAFESRLERAALRSVKLFSVQDGVVSHGLVVVVVVAKKKKVFR